MEASSESEPDFKESEISDIAAKVSSSEDNKEEIKDIVVADLPKLKKNFTGLTSVRTGEDAESPLPKKRMSAFELSTLDLLKDLESGWNQERTAADKTLALDRAPTFKRWSYMAEKTN